MTVDGVRQDGRLRVFDEDRPGEAFIEVAVGDLATDPDAGRR